MNERPRWLARPNFVFRPAIVLILLWSFSPHVGLPEIHSPNLWQTQPLFILERLNYKPFKSLHYDVVLNRETCKLQAGRPVDFYYAFNSGEESGKRLEMSTSSLDYFGVEKIQQTSAQQLTFSLYALEQITAPLLKDRRVYVQTKKDPRGNCSAQAFVRVGEKRLQLQRVLVKLKKLLGIPVGINFILLHGRQENGATSFICVMGECPDPNEL